MYSLKARALLIVAAENLTRASKQVIRNAAPLLSKCSYPGKDALFQNS